MRVVLKFLGLMIMFISGYMMIPFLVAVLTEGEDQYAFARSIFVGVSVGAAFLYFGRRSAFSKMNTGEVFMSVSMAWVMAGAISAYPYWLYGAAATYTDAFFESMSGFTTTGATIFENLGELPHCLLTWRAMTHWLGGMGIIALTLVMMPLGGASGFMMYSAEAPGMTHEKITPRFQQTAIYLWGIYFAFTVALTLLLMLGGMDFFEALNHSMATVSTGGFSTTSGGIASFRSPFCELAIIIFMYLSGANFVLHFYAIKNGSIKDYFRDPEFRLYTIVAAVLSILASLDIYFSGVERAPLSALRSGAFQVISFITSTGFVSSNYDLWPEFARTLLFICLFPGGCAGSTAGGIKHIRVLVMLRHVKRQLSRTLNPRSVLVYSAGSGALEPAAVSSCMAFFGLFLVVYALGAFAVSLYEPDLLTALSGTASALGNVGPAFGRLGAMSTFSEQAWQVKWIYSFLMLCGRLELYTVVALFSGAFRREGIIEE
ncbi:MAG: TrkH family potassium uptake protein [Synergistaceae bacterium]|nr:TrkH family potassium uptake protein [Synergistaceae bacterium]